MCGAVAGCGAVRAVLVCGQDFTTAATTVLSLIENFADCSLATVKQPKHTQFTAHGSASRVVRVS